MTPMKASSIQINQPVRLLRKLSIIALACGLPAVLAACGSAGGGKALKSSASLAPPTDLARKQVSGPVAPKVLSQAKTVSNGLAKSAGKSKGGTTPPIALAAVKADTPPAPVRRPYRKMRPKKSKSHVVRSERLNRKKRAKSSLQKPNVIKAITRKIVLAKPSVPTSVAAKAAMVPVHVIPVQIMPSGDPQDIIDAVSETPAVKKPALEQVAKAQSVPAEHSFGKAEHNFSKR